VKITKNKRSSTVTPLPDLQTA